MKKPNGTEVYKLEYQEIALSELKPFKIRDTRRGVLDRLKERIASGYNPARPLSVIKDNGHYLTADGNHRLEVLQGMGISSVQCIVYPEGTDPYSLAVSCNQDEDTYAPMDLFDWLDVVGRLREDGLTQAKIGERIGWSREVVAYHLAIIDKVVTSALALAKKHQEGRAAKDVTNVTNFTEGWFRNSGLYEVGEKYQIRLMQDFINDKCGWRKEKVQREASKYRQWQELYNIAKEELANNEDLAAVLGMIENDTFKNTQQVRNKIESLNKAAANKLICGDCISELGKIEDSSIDIVITDPPYGIDYSSNRSKYTHHITKNKIKNDSDLSGTLTLLDDVCERLYQKTKGDAHLYFFTSWKVFSDFVSVIADYFEVKNMIVWDKGNHGSGDLKGSWGNRHELIIFAVKGQKPINTRKPDIISIPKVNSQKAIHPTQKPTDVIKELLSVSSQKADTVCDPFMGSGSTIKSVKEYGGLSYVGIEIDRDVFEKAKTFIG